MASLMEYSEVLLKLKKKKIIVLHCGLMPFQHIRGHIRETKANTDELQCDTLLAAMSQVWEVAG